MVGLVKVLIVLRIGADLQVEADLRIGADLRVEADLQVEDVRIFVLLMTI